MIEKVSEDLIDYIVRVTGVDRELVIKVLDAERMYYLSILLSNDDSS